MTVTLGNIDTKTSPIFLNKSGTYRNTDPATPSQVVGFIKNNLKENPTSKGFAVVIKEVYSFEASNEKAQAVAIEKYQNINVEWDWQNTLISEWTNKLSLLGFEDAEIRFSGFWSQGDGASFTANICLEKFIKSHKLGNKHRMALNAAKQDKTDISIFRNSYNAVHETSISVHAEYRGESEEIDYKIGKVAHVVLIKAREYSKQIYMCLQNEFEYLTSREAIIDTFEANEWLFTSDGKKF